MDVWRSLTSCRKTGKGGVTPKTAATLVELARAHDPAVGLKAFTLKEESPSMKVLTRLGFAIVGSGQDEDAGEVWEWRL